MNNQNNQIVGYDAQTGQPIYKPIKKGGFKNFLIYELFNFIFSIIVPLILLFINMSLMTSERATILETIILLVQIIAFLLFKEVLVCKLAKSAAKSTYLMGKFVFVLNFLDIILATFLLFSNHLLLSIGIVFYLGFVVCKIISYILVKLLVLKEKIEYKKYLIVGAVSYIALFTFLYYATNPTGLNKMLFNIFGKTEFSSKELKIEIVDYYNKNAYSDDVNYTHKFTKEELYELKNLVVNNNITVDDLAMLSNVTSLELNNINCATLDFSKNSNLVSLEIKNSKIENLNTSNLESVLIINLSDTEVNNLIVDKGKIEALDIKKGKINELKISGDSLEEIYLLETSIDILEIKNTTNLKKVSIEKSNITNALLDNNKYFDETEYDKYVDIKIENIDNLELKNINNYINLSSNSNFTFKKLTIMENKKIYLESNSYINLRNNSIEIPKGTKVKELILENMTAIVTDIYHDLISCDDSGMCSYDEEDKRKVQGADSILGDVIEIFDENNNKIFEWNVSDYEEGEY